MLQVEITPTTSASFCGESFSAKITFTNSIEPDLDILKRDLPPQPSTNNTLADYNSRLLDFDEVPASPFFNSTAKFEGHSGNALPTPLSATFHHTVPPVRSFSGAQSSNNLNTTTISTVLSRKGLIGKPLVQSMPLVAASQAQAHNRRSSVGIYSTGIRKPGSLAHHLRAQSVSNPDLLHREVDSKPKSGRSRLSGGSINGESSFFSDGTSLILSEALDIDHFTL